MLDARRPTGESASGCTDECTSLGREIERLSVVCPAHAPTLVATAVLAYDNHRLERAQQLLDDVLGQSGTHPDAAALRARIALEEGNLPYARRLLDQHLSLSPDHAALHETLGAVLYLQKDLTAAQTELATALALGAPHWRIAYHLGLIDEASGRIDDALRHYTEALEGNAKWLAAQSRINALRAKRPGR
jgi:tetratricopeptide (TPR) repeat protein